MNRFDERRSPGSFYRLTLGQIAQANPNESSAWHRKRAREVLEAVNAAGSDAAFPPTREDLEEMREDFGTPDESQWEGATSSRRTSTDTGAVQVMLNNGIIGIRNSAHPSKVLLLTQSEWRSLLAEIKLGGLDFFAREDPRARNSGWFVDQLQGLSKEDRRGFAEAAGVAVAE
jgi:Domain of unknown function (DUF397)